MKQEFFFRESDAQVRRATTQSNHLRHKKTSDVAQQYMAIDILIDRIQLHELESCKHKWTQVIAPFREHIRHVDNETMTSTLWAPKDLFAELRSGFNSSDTALVAGDTIRASLLGRTLYCPGINVVHRVPRNYQLHSMHMDTNLYVKEAVGVDGEGIK